MSDTEPDNCSLFTSNFKNAEDALSLNELYDQALSIYKQVQDTVENDKRKTQILSGIRLLQIVSTRIQGLSLFTKNETADELPTSELRFLLVDAMLASLYQTKPCKAGKRLPVVELACRYYGQFLSTCADYGLIDAEKVDEILREVDEAPTEPAAFDIRKAAKTRQEKIENFKRNKALEQRIAELEMQDIEDEELLRELNMCRIRWWLQKAQDDVKFLKEEQCLLKSRQIKPLETAIPAEPQRQKASPFILLSTKQDRKAQVLGPAYPSQPSLSIEQFYDSLRQRGIISQCHQMSPAPPKSEEEEKVEAEEAEEKGLDDELLKSRREMDDWKDYHRRGEGNRYNRS